MGFVDLHIHSTVSDGEYSPLDILQAAHRNSIGIISLTDHDAILGCKTIYEQSPKYGIKVIPGIEFSTYDNGSVHILGYNIDLYSSRLISYCNQKKRENAREFARVIRELHDQGIDIPLNEIKNNYQRINVKNVITFLVDRDICSSRNEANAICYRFNENAVRQTEGILKTKDCISFIHELGGVAILAHPMLLTDNREMLARKIEEYYECGLDGLECIHPRHSRQDTEWCKGIASSHGMLMTGGSDFHGNKNESIELARIGESELLMML